MTLLRALAHKQPVCYFNFHRPGGSLPRMGSLELEPSVGPAAAEVTPGAGALPKEISMGLQGLAKWLDRWTSLSEKVMVLRQGGVASAPPPPAAPLLVGASLCLWEISAEISFFPYFCFLISQIHVEGSGPGAQTW